MRTSKNLSYVILLIILSIISCFLTLKLTDMRIKSIEDRVEDIEYNIETIDSVIRELLN